MLEPLNAYLMLAERLCVEPDSVEDGGAWNIGPDAAENRPVRAVAEALVAALGRGRVELTLLADAPHEAHLLALDCSKARARLGWQPRLDFAATIAMTASWYSAWARGEAMAPFTRAQIAAFTEAGARPARRRAAVVYAAPAR